MSQFHKKPLPEYTTEELIDIWSNVRRKSRVYYERLLRSREKSVKVYGRSAVERYNAIEMSGFTVSHIKGMLSRGEIKRSDLLRLISSTERWMSQKNVKTTDIRKIYKQQMKELTELGFDVKDPQEILNIYSGYLDYTPGEETLTEILEIPSDIKNIVRMELLCKHTRVTKNEFINISMEKIRERTKKQEEEEAYWKNKQAF